ncbi:dockerin type I repeat-containing protein [Scatolibacter rhodanostii]|uniref:dockerin type I repeat-containing protein n=1 Tax=Scatolibacter rhodanostii TaxID=2014781 RepID=UPI000C075BA2|nr:dockerin type I repeat-containing protein [Scatolibacter rhodanostii]
MTVYSRKTTLCFVAFFLILSVLFLTGLRKEYENPNYVSFYQLSDGNLENSLLYEEAENGILYCFNDNLKGVALLLNTEGQVLYERHFDTPLYKAVLRDNKLFLLTENEAQKMSLYQLDASTLNESNSSTIDSYYSDISQIDFDYDGNFYVVTWLDLTTVLSFSFDGTYRNQFVSSSPIEFLQFFSDTLYLYTDNQSWLSLSTDDLAIQSNLPLPSKPAKIMNEYLLLDIDGNFLDYSQDNFPLIFSSPLPFTEFLFHAWNNENQILWANEQNEIVRYSLESNQQDSFRTDGSIYAIAGHSAIASENGTLYYVSLNSFQEKTPEPTVTPSPIPTDIPSKPTKSPKPSATPTEKPDISEFILPNWAEENGDYLYIKDSKTIALLKETLSPFTVMIQDKNRNTVSSGNLRTGFAISVENQLHFELVLIGDCNASGTVNTADIKEMQRAVLGSNLLEGASFAAADLNRDNRITTADLILLSEMIQNLK